MAFERPIVAVRTLADEVDPSAQYFMSSIYEYLDSSVVTGIAIASGGTGYAVNDTVKPNDGTAILEAEFTVTQVSGGVITAIEITSGKGGLYSSNPTTTPNDVSTVTGTGSGAQINLTMTQNWTPSLSNLTTDTGLTAVAVNAGGSGYVVDDILTVAGGTSVYAATILVTAVDGGGAVTAVEVEERGSYSVNPTTTGNAVTGGTGSSATMDLTMSTNSQGSGSYSFKAKSNAIPSGLSEAIEINLKNAGTASAPNETTAAVGINPDGTTAPIADSAAPAGSNYSSTVDGVNAFFFGAGSISKLFLIFDFGDALYIFFPHVLLDRTIYGFMAGQVYQSRWTDDYDGNNGATSVRMDGLAIIGYLPYGYPGTAGTLWFSSTAGTRAVRLAEGNSSGATSLFSWMTLADSHHSGASQTFNFKNGAKRPASLELNHISTGVPVGEMKHLKLYEPALPFTKRQSGGVDYLMHLSYLAAVDPLCIHIPDGFNPFVDGIYVP